MTSANCPPNFKSMPGGDIQKYLVELVKLAPSSFMGVTIPLEVLLGAATAAGSEKYLVPSETDLVIFQIQSMFRSTNLAAEPVLNANLTLDLDGLAEARLQNALAELSIKERKLDIIEGAALNMAAHRKAPVYFLPNAPLIVPAGNHIELKVTLQSVAAAIAGSNAYYGYALTGVLIPRSV